MVFSCSCQHSVSSPALALSTQPWLMRCMSVSLREKQLPYQLKIVWWVQYTEKMDRATGQHGWTDGLCAVHVLMCVSLGNKFYNNLHNFSPWLLSKNYSRTSYTALFCESVSVWPFRWTDPGLAELNVLGRLIYCNYSQIQGYAWKIWKKVNIVPRVRHRNTRVSCI